MDRSQKLLNLFVSETKESACICITAVIDFIMAIQQLYIFLGLTDIGPTCCAVKKEVRRKRNTQTWR